MRPTYTLATAHEGFEAGTPVTVVADVREGTATALVLLPGSIATRIDPRLIRPT